MCMQLYTALAEMAMQKVSTGGRPSIVINLSTMGGVDEDIM